MVQYLVFSFFGKSEFEKIDRGFKPHTNGLVGLTPGSAIQQYVSVMHAKLNHA